MMGLSVLTHILRSLFRTGDRPENQNENKRHIMPGTVTAVSFEGIEVVLKPRQTDSAFQPPIKVQLTSSDYRALPNDNPYFAVCSLD